MGTGVVSDGGSPEPSIRVSSSFGGVGGMMFVTGGGGRGVSRIGAGVSVRAAAIGGDGSSRNLLGRLGDEDEDDANQARFLGTSLTSGSGSDRPASTDGRSEFGKLAGAASDSGRSSGGIDGVAATLTVEWEAGCALAGCSLGGGGGACSASSFRGTVDEPRRDNDANHERGRGGAGGAGGVGVDIGPGVSGVAFVVVSVGSESEAGGSPALLVGEGEEVRCARSSGGSSGIRQSELRD